MNPKDLKGTVNFFFETGLLQRLKRSGIDFLGSGDQSVGSHVFRTAVIGYVLGELMEVDTAKVVMMCLFHDVEESRTGDLNYLQQRYVTSQDETALAHSVNDLPVKNGILSLVSEFEQLDSPESLAAKDADTLELLLFLKEELDKGNPQAAEWMVHARKRLKTALAESLAAEIEQTHYTEWWKNLTDEWDKGTKRW